MNTKTSMALLFLLMAPAQVCGARIRMADEDEEDETNFNGGEESVEDGGEEDVAEEDGDNVEGDEDAAERDEDVVEGDKGASERDEDVVEGDKGASEGPAPDSFLGDGMGIELVADDDEGTTIFRADESSEIVQAAKGENPDAEVKSVLEIRTKLKFTSNRQTLRNPELVEGIVNDIKEQQEQLPGLNFVFCLHVGTTQVDRILETRPGFMEGRVKSVKDALQPEGEIPGVSGTIAADFMHFESTRFAGLVMWAYGGETAPECAKEDLKPPA